MLLVNTCWLSVDQTCMVQKYRISAFKRRVNDIFMISGYENILWQKLPIFSSFSRFSIRFLGIPVYINFQILICGFHSKPTKNYFNFINQEPWHIWLHYQNERVERGISFTCWNTFENVSHWSTLRQHIHTNCIVKMLWKLSPASIWLPF